MRRLTVAVVLVLALGGVATGSSAAEPSPADLRYARAITDSGYDPASPYWSRFAKDACATLRAGGGPTRQVREVGVSEIAYIFGSAVGAYCRDQEDRAVTWISEQG